MKRCLLLALAVAFTAVCYFSWQVGPPRDPVYQGHPLSWWLRGANRGSGASEEDVRNASKQGGAEALRWLIWAAEHGHRPDPPLASEPGWKLLLRHFHVLRPAHTKDGPYDERSAAVSALGGLYPENLAAIPVLGKLLEDTDEYLARQAAHLLEQMQPDAWPTLLQAAQHPSAQVRWIAYKFLVPQRYVGRPPTSEADVARIVDALIKGFSDPDPRVRAEAANSFGNCRGGGELKPQLSIGLSLVAALLSDPDPRVRQHAGWALFTFGPEASAMIPAIMAALEDPDPKVRARMAFTLSSVDRKDQRSKERLWQMTQEPDLACRIAAAATLARFGEKPTAVITELTELLASDTAQERGQAMNGLTEIGPPAGPAMPAILEALKRPIDNMRVHPWQVVLNFDRFDRNEAIPYIVQAMRHPVPAVRSAAVQFFKASLQGTDRPEVREALQVAAKDADAHTRNAAESVLQQIREWR